MAKKKFYCGMEEPIILVTSLMVNIALPSGMEALRAAMKQQMQTAFLPRQMIPILVEQGITTATILEMSMAMASMTYTC